MTWRRVPMFILAGPATTVGAPLQRELWVGHPRWWGNRRQGELVSAVSRDCSVREWIGREREASHPGPQVRGTGGALIGDGRSYLDRGHLPTASMFHAVPSPTRLILLHVNHFLCANAAGSALRSSSRNCAYSFSPRFSLL